jgi:hypothetical protein
MEPVARRSLLARLRKPVPWRPAMQVGDASYPITKLHLLALVQTAQRPRLR